MEKPHFFAYPSGPLVFLCLWISVGRDLCILGFRTLCVRVSCEFCRQAPSGQLSFVQGLLACWQSQSLRITFPAGSLSLVHKVRDSYSDKQTAWTHFGSRLFPFLLSLDTIILSHSSSMKRLFIQIWGIAEWHAARLPTSMCMISNAKQWQQ